MGQRVIPQEDFIRLWNESASTFSVAEIAGTTRAAVVARACRLRRDGFVLQRFVQNRDPDRAELRSLAAKSRDAHLREVLRAKLPVDFFETYVGTSWTWMSQQTGLDERTLRKIAEDQGFEGNVAGVKRVAYFTCPDQVRDYIDGLLLSDAGLGGVGRRMFTQESVSLDWLQQIQDQFQSWGVDSVIDPNKRPGRKPSFSLRTPVYQTFGMTFGTRWYPQGVKVIPRDLNLSSGPLLRNLYLGDGTMAGNVLEVCMEGFQDEDVEWMRDELNRVHGLNVGLRQVKAGLRLKIYARWRNHFYDLIEQDIPPSLQHRFCRSTGRFQR